MTYHDQIKHVRDCLEEAMELAHRFPDLPDGDVIDHVEYVMRMNVKEGTVLEKAILIAYNKKDSDEGMKYAYPEELNAN